MIKNLVFVCILLAANLGLFLPVLHSQFNVDHLEEFTGFEFEKPVQFWTTPRFNRVEGLFVNPGIKLFPSSIPKFHFYGYLGVGFWNEDSQRFRFLAGVRKDIGDIERVSLGGEFFRKVDSKDDWVIGELENSIFALIGGTDYRDYWSSLGFKFYIDYKLLGLHTLRLEVARRKFEALQKNIDWNLLGDDFPPNPRRSDSFIQEGNEFGLRLISTFDWRDNPIFPLTGWYLEAIYEPTFEDFKTQGLFLTGKFYGQTWSNQRLILQARLGSRSGEGSAAALAPGASIDSLNIAQQYALEPGGIGTLRGFDDKEFLGNRMFMFNINYYFGGDILQKIPLHSVPVIGTFWTTLSLGVFMDTGWAWRTDPDDFLLDGLGQLSFDNLKTDLGLSLLVLEGVFRMDVAKRTDRSNDDFRVTFRILEKL